VQHRPLLQDVELLTGRISKGTLGHWTLSGAGAGAGAELISNHGSFAVAIRTNCGLSLKIPLSILASFWSNSHTFTVTLSIIQKQNMMARVTSLPNQAQSCNSQTKLPSPARMERPTLCLATLDLSCTTYVAQCTVR